MSTCDRRDVTALHRPLTDRFPKAFSQNYDARVLAHHTRRDGYLLALLHHRGDRRYDLDGQPAGTVTDAARLLEASTQRGQAKAEQVRTHKAREEKRRQQRAEEQRWREEKARRKAEHERVQQEIAARKAALIAQGITPESRSERKRRLAREAAERAARRSQAPRPTPDRLPERAAHVPAPRPERPPERPAHVPAPHPERLPDRADPAPTPSMPHVEFRKKRRIVPPDQKGPA